MSMMTMMMITAHSKTMQSSNMNATQHDETTEGRNHMSKRKKVARHGQPFQPSHPRHVKHASFWTHAGESLGS